MSSLLKKPGYLKMVCGGHGLPAGYRNPVSLLERAITDELSSVPARNVLAGIFTSSGAPDVTSATLC